MKYFTSLLRKSAFCSLTAILLLTCTLGFALKYPVSSIDENLRKNANAVYRVNSIQYIFNDESSFTVVYKKAVTILNENGKGHHLFIQHYDEKLSKVDFVEGNIYDASGARTKKIKRKDLHDQSGVGYELFSNNRVVGYEPTNSNYPYTVEFSWAIDYKRGMYYSNDFLAAPGFNISSEFSELIIQCGEGMDIKFKEFNIEDENRKVEHTDNQKIYSWTFKNIEAVDQEYRSLEPHHYVPSLRFAVNKFEFDGFVGNSDTWNDYGAWIAKINSGRDDLPEEKREMIQELVKNATSNREKVSLLYDYLQENTRYVNIPIGIGGIQPIDATTVSETGYGDCKALSNYMKALLKAVDIPSYYTVVKAGAGNYSFMNEFPTFQFNHAILCVPLDGDTVWLECTSQVNPFNHLSDFTDGRYVLLITEDGGKLIKTPGYDLKQNIHNIKADIHIKESGRGKAIINFSAGGIYFSDYFGIERLSQERQEKVLYYLFDLPDFTIDNFNAYSETDNLLSNITFEASLNTYGSVSGNRISIPLNPLSGTPYNPKRERNRKTDFKLTFNRYVNDTIVFSLPQGYVLESNEPVFEQSGNFGEFTTEFLKKDDKYYYIRKFVAADGIFEPEKYEEFYDFYRNIDRFESQNITFVKN